MRSRAVVAVALAALVGGALSVASASATQAAWGDRSYASAAVTAGTWAVSPTLGCTAMQAGGVTAPAAACTVTSVTYSQWYDGVDVVRDYYVAYSMTGGAYPAVLVDLSKGSGTSSGGGAWTWGGAVTLATGQYAAASGLTCGELPILRADGPSWGTSSTFWVRVVMDRSMPLATGVTCS